MSTAVVDVDGAMGVILIRVGGKFRIAISKFIVVCLILWIIESP